MNADEKKKKMEENGISVIKLADQYVARRVQQVGEVERLGAEAPGVDHEPQAQTQGVVTKPGQGVVTKPQAYPPPPRLLHARS